MVSAVAEPRVSESLLGPRLTLDEWGGLPEDVPGEFIDDRLVEEEVPDYLHEVLVVWLARMLGNWGEERNAIVGGSDAKLAVNSRRGRKPDLTVYLGGRRPPARGVVRVPPDIAVEVISSSPQDDRRDRVEKPAEYAAFGIRFDWLVDPQSRTLEIWRLDPSGCYECVLRQERGLVTIDGCDGLVLDLDAMWAKADALDE
jgi:Uma2 family endonuclease